VTASFIPPRSDARGAASRATAALPIRRGILELEDFGVPAKAATTKPTAEVAEFQADVAPDPDLVTMTQADIDILREAAYREGLEKGARDKEDALQAHYASCLSSLSAAFQVENDRRSQVLAEAAKSFPMTVVDIVRSLTALDGTVLAGLQRDLVSDASAFVSECDGAVTVQCDTADAQRLQSLLKGRDGVRIEAVQGTGEGAICIVSAANTIVIDPEQWRKSIAEKIVAAVTALAEQRVDLNMQKA
jgi:hypothetical protein